MRHREGNHPHFFICLKAADPVAQGTLENNKKDPTPRLSLSCCDICPLLSMLTPSEVNPVNVGGAGRYLQNSTEKESLKGKKLKPQR